MTIFSEFAKGISAALGVSAPQTTKSLEQLQDFAQGSGGTSISLFGQSLAPGSKELLAAYNKNPTIRKVVNLIANALAQTVWYLETGKAGSGRKRALKAVGRQLSKADNATRIDDHDFLDFLLAGNPVMAGPTGWKLSFIYYLLKGEFYWLLLPGPTGAPQWMVIPPQNIRENANGSWKITFGMHAVTAPVEMVFYVRDPNVLDPYGRGSGIGDALRDEVDTDEYAASLLRTALANKGILDGIVQITGANRDTLEAARIDYESKHRGHLNAGKTMFIDGTTVKHIPLAQAFSELRLLELREAEKALIEETFGVPPELFGKVTNSNRSTIWLAQDILARNKLIPILSHVSLELNIRLLPSWDKGNRHVLKFESPAPTDAERKIELFKLSPHSFKVNEIRALGNYPAQSWGEVRYVPANLIELPAPEDKKTRALVGTGKALVTKSVSEDQIAKILALYDPAQLAERLGPMWQSRMNEIVTGELAALGVAGNFEVINPLIEDHLRLFGLERLKVPLGTSAEFASVQIAAGVNNLESIQSIARRLVATGATDQAWRARLTARTEVVHSANTARHVSWGGSGLELAKTWLSSLSDDTRGSHAALHNVTVPLAGRFVFSASLDPGIYEEVVSPGASQYAAHACNCECTIVATDPEDVAELAFGGELHVKALDDFAKQRKEWEEEARKEISDFYADVETQTLEILGVSRDSLE